MKKVCAILMTLCLLVGFFPAGGLAVSADVGDISKTEVEPNSTMSLADRIYDDYTVSGVVSGTDMDYFKFTLSSRSTISIITMANYKSCFMAGVFTPSQVAVAASSFVEYSDSGRPCYLTTATLDAGTYYYVLFNENASTLRNVYTFYFTYTATGHTHTYSYSCDSTCNTCAYTRDVVHTYDAECDAVCNVCGETRTTVIAHTVDADCATVCNLCRAEVAASVSHTYTDKCDATCDVCGYTRSAPHQYTNQCDTSCNLCKATRTATHKYTTVTKKATATANGYTVKCCSVCKKETGKTTIYKANKISLSKTTYTYNGKAQKPTVTVKDAKGNKIATSNYTVTYASGRKNVGTYKVTVKMKGNYSGTKTLTFKIKPVSLSKCKISLSKTTYTYNGSAKKPTVTVKNASGTKLTNGSSYTVTYASGRKNVGTYKVTVKGKGNYTGTKTLTFKINPPATSVSKLTAEKKSIKVSYSKKTSQVTGYQIQYSTSKSFKSYKTKTVTSAKTASVTLSGLKTKTIYYVRVRTYKTVGKTKYYSAWSSVKSKCTAHTHVYSKATCTKAKTCKYCKATSGKALGHSKNTVNCTKCGTLLFKGLTYTGTGIKKISSINIPEGDFILKLVATGTHEDVIDNCFVKLYDGNSRLRAHTGVTVSVPIYGWSSSDSDTFDVGIKNGTIKVDAPDDIRWTITITAY